MPVVEFVYLIEILLLSLADSLVSSVVISVIAVGCLNFFQRATEIVRRVRTLTKRTVVEMSRLEINDAVNDRVAPLRRRL